MKNDQKVIDAIIEKIKDDYTNDIALLIAYGRSKQYDNLGKSLYFISKTGRGNALSMQFLINGVSYDLFPIGWDRLVANASLDSPQGYLLVGTEILYVGDEEVLRKFTKLKDSLETLLASNGLEMKLNKAYEYLNECYIYLYNMRTYDDFSSIRLEGGKLMNKIANGLSFINNVCYQGGNGTILKESLELKILPKDYKMMVDDILFANDVDTIIGSSEIIIGNTRDLLINIKKMNAQVEPFETLFTGYYEEIVKSLNKCRNAILENDYYQLNELCGYIQEEVAIFLTKVERGIWYDDRNAFVEYSLSFKKVFDIDLLSNIAKKDNDEIRKNIDDLEKGLLQMVLKNDVPVLKFESVEGFKVFLSESR